MEDVFALATPDELRDLFGDEEDIALARRYNSPDSQHANLAALYLWRGNRQKSDEHLALIKDWQMRFDTMLALHEFVQ
jgi:hypothetical protein